MHEQLAGPDGPGLGESFHETGQGVVRDGQQDQVGALENLGRGHQRHIWQEQRGTAPGGVGDPGDGHRAVSGELEGRREGGADAARADDADAEACGSVLGFWLGGCTHSTAAFRSSPLGVPDDFSSC